VTAPIAPEQCCFSGENKPSNDEAQISQEPCQQPAPKAPFHMADDFDSSLAIQTVSWALKIPEPHN